VWKCVVADVYAKHKEEEGQVESGLQVDRKMRYMVREVCVACKRDSSVKGGKRLS